MAMISHRHLAVAAAASLSLCFTRAGAADTAPAAPAAPAAAKADPLGAARGLVQQKRWSAAVDELRRVDNASSADWNNLMGYSLRKGTPPDHVGAEKHYGAALRIDPTHRGALEYSGELYLITGNLPMAEQRLAALDKACRMPCEEYTDLKQAVARFKANGNKYAAP